MCTSNGGYGTCNKGSYRKLRVPSLPFRLSYRMSLPYIIYCKIVCTYVMNCASQDRAAHMHALV